MDDNADPNGTAYNSMMSVSEDDRIENLKRTLADIHSQVQLNDKICYMYIFMVII